MKEKHSLSFRHKRVWKARSTDGTEDNNIDEQTAQTFWNESISEMDNETIQGILQRVGMQVGFITI